MPLRQNAVSRRWKYLTKSMYTVPDREVPMLAREQSSLQNPNNNLITLNIVLIVRTRRIP